MKSDKISRTIRLGIFMAAGLVLLSMGLYFIGDKRNLFGGNFRLVTMINDVNGLREGNNVRFAGVDVGTIDDIRITSDSLVEVTMLMDRSVRGYIRKNAVVSIETDGLMGNKIMRIRQVPEPAGVVEEGDQLNAVQPVSMEDVLESLAAGSENIRSITAEMHLALQRISQGGALDFLSDPSVASDLRLAVSDVRDAAQKGSILTTDLQTLSARIRNGEGSIGQLLSDTLLASDLTYAAGNVRSMSDSAKLVVENMNLLLVKLNNGDGTIGALLNDTVMARDISTGIDKLKDGAQNFNQAIEALETMWPFRRYFRRKARNDREQQPP